MRQSFSSAQGKKLDNKERRAEMQDVDDPNHCLNK
jgi:hypothetical protein